MLPRTDKRPFPGEVTVITAVALLAMAIRVWLLPRFDMVTFDGTFYINQADGLSHGRLAGGTFPIGYPAAIAVARAFLSDGAKAAAAISILASIGAIVVVYQLARRGLSVWPAVLCAAAFALNPLVTRVSLLAYSESLYVFWLLIGILWFSKSRYVLAGLAMGLAILTRPEAIVVAGVLALWRHVRWTRRMWRYGLPVLALYAGNVATLSIMHGETTLLSRQAAYDSVALPWQMREELTGSDVEEQMRDAYALSAPNVAQRASGYFERLPRELLRIARYMMPLLFCTALFALARAPGPAAAALVPLLFLPIFTDDRGEGRWIMPYIPVFVLCGVQGIAMIGWRNVRSILYAAAVVSVALNLLVNRSLLAKGENTEYRGSRQAGLMFRNAVSREDKIADRKPFFAFYAGGSYVQIPIGPYGATLDRLTADRVRLLSLHAVTTHVYRPSLQPLLYDDAVIRGEVRFRQVHVARTGELIYERVRDEAPLTWTAFSRPDGADAAPAFSRDGRLALRRRHADGTSGIYAHDGDAIRRLGPGGERDDAISWSPDSRFLAFSTLREGNEDIYQLNALTGAVSRITSDPAADWSPSWSPNGDSIAFCSNRGGRRALWIQNLERGTATQLPGTEDAAYPSFAPSNERIAFADSTGRLTVLDLQTRQRFVLPDLSTVSSPPSWHPGGDFLAVDATDWGNRDIYLVRSDARAALLLTNAASMEAMPCWNVEGTELVIVSDRGGKPSLWRLGGIAPYIERLQKNERIATFVRPPKRPSEAR